MKRTNAQLLFDNRNLIKQIETLKAQLAQRESNIQRMAEEIVKLRAQCEQTRNCPNCGADRRYDLHDLILERDDLRKKLADAQNEIARLRAEVSNFCPGKNREIRRVSPDQKESKATWYQLYETVSESPVTPPFETPEELIEYLSTKGGIGGRRWERADAEAFVFRFLHDEHYE